MLFSVIVPIYKVEKYLHVCINSVLSQNFADVELILVDDGSPDNCPLICDKYADGDSRVHAIHQANSGVSSARNTGIKAAHGDYIVFLDADDEMQPDALPKLAEKLKGYGYPDLLFVNFSHWIDNEEIIIESNEKYLAQRYSNVWSLCQAYAQDNAQIPWRPYQSVVNRRILSNKELFFDESYTVGEDCDFFLRLIDTIESFEVCDVNMVKYRAFRSDSLVNTQSFKNVYSQLTVFAKYAEYYDRRFGDRYLMRRYFADRFTNIIILVSLLAQEKEKQVCYEFIRTKKHIIRYTSRHPKYLFARLIWACLGYGWGSDLLTKLKKMTGKISG